MDYIKTIDDIKNHAAKWNPSNILVDTIEEASDNINFPHEDYPLHVNSTILAITHTVDILRERNLTENDIRFIHKVCMKEKEFLQLGQWRTGEVIVNQVLCPPQPYLISPYMMSILPVGLEFQKTNDEILNWFKEFETIHPFEDGNGRVGGVVLAAMTFLLNDKFLVPKKFKK